MIFLYNTTSEIWQTYKKRARCLALNYIILFSPNNHVVRTLASTTRHEKISGLDSPAEPLMVYMYYIYIYIYIYIYGKGHKVVSLLSATKHFLNTKFAPTVRVHMCTCNLNKKQIDPGVHVISLKIFTYVGEIHIRFFSKPSLKKSPSDRKCCSFTSTELVT